MTRFVNFGGQTQFKPGGLTRINPSALAPIGLSATGIVHLLGEADGGIPGASGLIIMDDPAEAKAALRSGPLADAIRVAFGPSGDSRIPGGAFRCVIYKTNNSTQSGTQLPGDDAFIADTAAGAPTTTSIQLTTNTTMVVNAHAGRWFKLVATGEKRRIVSNTVDTIVVSPGFKAAPAAAAVVQILQSQLLLTSADYGAHTNQVSVEFEAGVGDGFVVTLAFEDQVERSPEVGGESFLDLKYVGGPSFIAGNSTAIDATGLIITTDISAVGANDAAGMFMRFADGSQREIASNTIGPASVYTLSAGHALTTSQIAALAVSAVDVINVLTSAVSITGTNGLSTGLTSTVTPTADNLAIVFATAGLTTLRQLVDYLNGNTNYEATIPNGVNPDTTLLNTYDFSQRNTAVDVRFGTDITPSTKGTFRRDLQEAVDWINRFATLATAARATVGATEGSEIPDYTGGVSGTIRDVPVFFIGGTRGISANSNFQAGFDELVQTRANHIVPFISQDLTNEGNGSTAEMASVAAQLLSHVQYARLQGKNEQGGYLGFKGTKTQFLAQAAALNDTDVQLIPQQMAFLDVDGNLKLMDEWASACAAAGMRSGANEVGEPLTFKYIKTSQLEWDSSWSPTNRTDINQLLQGGIMFAEIAAGGVRWVRDITTHLKNDDTAFIDGSTRDAVRYVAYDLRQFLEDRFTGLKATPATAASIRESVAAKMADYLTDHIIVESLDPETETTIIKGFRNLRVRIVGTVADIKVEIFPVTGIVFQLNDIYLQLPIIVAA